MGKGLAKTENMDEGWQKIRKEHQGELVKNLEQARDDIHTFLLSVSKSAASVRKKASAAKMGQGKFQNKELEAAFKQILPSALEASVHIGAYGSGVMIPSINERCTWVLTCAHCVDHDNDPTDSGDEEYSEDEQGRSPRCPVAVDRIGRWKSVIRVDGSVFAAKCIACCEDDDLALLEAFELPSEYAPVSGVEITPGCPVVCVGNPGDVRYSRFYMSCGKIKSIGTRNPHMPELGATIHSCWTYWGHSGAPLFNEKGEIVGLHNSWNNTTGARHAVCHTKIVAFLSDVHTQLGGKAPKRKRDALNGRSPNSKAGL